MHDVILLLGLAAAGVGVGVIAGLLGIGGGAIMVPLLVALGVDMVHAVGTSCLAITLTALSGSLQNRRMGVLDLHRVLGLGLPAAIVAALAATLAGRVPGPWLKTSFAALLLLNLYLIRVKNRLMARRSPASGANAPGLAASPAKRWAARLVTGGAGGAIAGFFGVGGGIVMVPMQLLLLSEPIKLAIQTSLGVIVIASGIAMASHATHHNVLYAPGLALGVGGVVGAQLGARFLPKLPDRLVGALFRGLLVVLAAYMLYKAWAAAHAA